MVVASYGQVCGLDRPELSFRWASIPVAPRDSGDILQRATPGRKSTGERVARSAYQLGFIVL